MNKKLQDSLEFVLDSLQQHPVLKGAIPSAVGGGYAIMEVVSDATTILGFISALLGCIIGSLTLYAKFIKVKK